ncbi:aminoglycoside phosphotransferase family protein [Streptomyces sp. NPDC001674]|uniref:phosphotransferase family protein n=1 Tax=Streptomyces sp. NPDC001674 TaxID=3154394 RepID=UPI00331A3EC5
MVTYAQEEQDGTEWAATRAWVEKVLPGGERIVGAAPLQGGWTSRMRRLELDGGAAGPRSLVLRSFVKPFYLRHADALLTREAAVLNLLGATGVPAAALVAVDATAEHCDHPSLLMSLLPGTVRIDGEGAARRAELLAGQLLDIHRIAVAPQDRPRAYEAWTSAERVTPPGHTRRPELWRRAVEVIRGEPPRHRAHFLHRDFHPGNVLFEGAGEELRISGVVDWVETSWGPADLDVAHCATSQALLHGAAAGLDFADRYTAAGGTLAEAGPDHLYWRLLDALAFAPEAEKVAVPWRALGRTDLTPAVLAARLEEYVEALFDRYA